MGSYMSGKTTGGEIDVSTLDAAISGAVIGPDHAEYDDARRVWNARYVRYPTAIARVADVEDVVEAVNFARDTDLRIAIRGGGHSYAGHGTCDDGLVIDCAAIDHVEVDPDAKRVRVGPGATWADVDAATMAHGLATTGATVSSVGVAGYTLGGGTGHLVRSLGTGADNLCAAEVVTAAGAVVRASDNENADLYWALRGGGANFGVVTEFEFALHELETELLAGQLVYRIEDAPEVLRFYRDFMADAPQAVNCYAFFIPLPPLDVFPAELHGTTAVDLVVSHTGPMADAEADLAPLREFGEPILDAVAPTPYVDLQQAFDAGTPSGNRWHSKAQYISTLPDDALDALIEAVHPIEGPFTMAYLEPLGGAVAAVDPAATAFPHREVPYSLHVLSGWTDPDDDDAMVEWTETVHETMTPYSPGGVYVNLLHRDEAERVPEAYGENLDRLADCKATWDPDNRFSVNQNIEPAR